MLPLLRPFCRRVHAPSCRHSREGAVDGFTKRYDITLLVWYELHDDMRAAIEREKRVKKCNRAWKIRLIENRNPDWSDFWPEITG